MIASPEDARAEFRIRVRGQVSARVVRMFPGFVAEDDGATTVMTGPVEDQVALYALLERLRTLGLELIDLAPAARDEAVGRASVALIGQEAEGSCPPHGLVP
jgi:hypothetical protein